MKKRGISIKYGVLYIHKENKLAKEKWCTIVIIKNSMLINSWLPNRFWAKAIETTNYLQNKFFTRSRNHGEMIPKEAWIKQKQDLYYVCIFGNLTFCNILEEKKLKSDYQKIWEKILIRYSIDTLKHLCIWAL